MGVCPRGIRPGARKQPAFVSKPEAFSAPLPWIVVKGGGAPPSQPLPPLRGKGLSPGSGHMRSPCPPRIGFVPPNSRLRPVLVSRHSPLAAQRPERPVALRPRLALVAIEFQQVRQDREESLGDQGFVRRRLVRADGLSAKHVSGRLELYGGAAQRRELGRADPAQLRLGDGGVSRAPGREGRAVAPRGAESRDTHRWLRNRSMSREPERPRVDDRELRGIGIDGRIEAMPQRVSRRPRLTGGGSRAGAQPRVGAVGFNLRLRGHRTPRPPLHPAPTGRRAPAP